MAMISVCQRSGMWLGRLARRAPFLQLERVAQPAEQRRVKELGALVGAKAQPVAPLVLLREPAAAAARERLQRPAVRLPWGAKNRVVEEDEQGRRGVVRLAWSVQEQVKGILTLRESEITTTMMGRPNPR